MQSLESHLLIASPDLPEPFHRAVVLLVRHNDEGAFGLIINRRTSASFKEAWTQISEVPCHREEPLYLGGPCQGPLMALHTNDFLLETEVLPGVYFCTDKEKLETLAAQSTAEQGPAKFFAGYSGWSAGQLEQELARGAWSVLPARPEFVFEHEDELWNRTRRTVADHAWRTTLNIKEAPPDPSLN